MNLPLTLNRQKTWDYSTQIKVDAIFISNDNKALGGLPANIAISDGKIKENLSQEELLKELAS